MRSVGRGDSTRLTLLLLLVVLAPSICLLWFMNQAVQNERLALRQKLGDALRARLAVAQQQLENDVASMKQFNDSLSEINDRVLPVLNGISGPNLGPDPEAWQKWPRMLSPGSGVAHRAWPGSSTRSSQAWTMPYRSRSQSRKAFHPCGVRPSR